MEALFYTSAGAAGAIGLILMRLAARHGLAWVRAELKARASAAEAAFKAKVASAQEMEGLTGGENYKRWQREYLR